MKNLFGRPEEPVKRLSLNLPESLHTRFKASCAATGRRMTPELQALVEQRTAELEAEMHGLSGPPRSPASAQANTSRIQALLDRRPRANRPEADFDAIPVDSVPQP